MFPKINPTQTQAWKKLENHYTCLGNKQMQQMFEEDPDRAHKMALSWNDFYLDFSKNIVNDETIKLLLDLAKEVSLKDAIEAQFMGEAINETENRAVGHTSLRDLGNLKSEVAQTLHKMEGFCEKIISGAWKGHTGKSIKTIVNIGIGGSDLGPDMVCESLKFYRNHLNLHFVSNIDGDHVMETLKTLDRETTLFIIVSKTFTTQETLTNAQTIRKWFLKEAKEEAIANHFVAVSTNLEAVTQFGISSINVFPMWNWVGGRFSLWSAVGLSIACVVGYKNFEDLLLGGHEMDLHFKNSEFDSNIPVILALLSVWYNNFFDSESECIVPYSQYLSKLVPYLQQGIMESNGKSVDRNGAPISYQTGTIVWGSTGTNAQHAFFQLLHQGTKLIPTDFIAYKNSLYGNKTHHHKLLANCFAQTEALLMGTFGSSVANNFKLFKGNKPTNTILIDQLTPKSLGSLIAMYEHKLFVQGVIWNIYSYDQWGVELGKNLAKSTLKAIEVKRSDSIHNSSTSNLISKLT